MKNKGVVIVGSLVAAGLATMLLLKKKNQKPKVEIGEVRWNDSTKEPNIQYQFDAGGFRIAGTWGMSHGQRDMPVGEYVFSITPMANGEVHFSITMSGQLKAGANYNLKTMIRKP